MWYFLLGVGITLLVLVVAIGYSMLTNPYGNK